MSETNNIPVVSRNSLTWPLADNVFGKKSPHSGRHFWAPAEPKAGEEETFFNWFGKAEAVKFLGTAARRIFADILIDNIGDDGIINEEQMQKDWADFTAGVQTLTDIDEQLDELQAKQQSIVMDEEFDNVDQITGQPLTEKAASLMAQLRQISLQVKPLKAEKARIEATYKERAEKRKAKKAAEKAPQVVES